MSAVLNESPKLARAREAEAGAIQRMHDASDAYEALPDDATDEVATAASEAFDAAEADVERARGEVTRLERIARGRELAPLPADPEPDPDPDPGPVPPGGRHARARGTSLEPLTYSERTQMQVSYVRDLARALHKKDSASWERLERHGKESVERRDITRVDGAGGEFVPPAWLMDKYFDLARPGRVMADLATQLPLTGGTDSLNIPKVTTGAAVAIQASDNAAVQETDMVTTSVSAPVRTIAGQQDVALQLLDQSPLNFDQIVFKSLISDYAQKLDLQVIAGAGTSGTLLGYGATVGINAVTYVDASPTPGELYSKVADAINRVQTARFLPAEAIVMHPRRWYWLLAQVDSSQRPLVVPTAQGPTNALATFSHSSSQGGPVGMLMGLPVYLDPSIAITAGAGTEDIIYIARFSDAYLFEGPMKTRVMFEVLSQTLTARFQVYNYVAFTAGGFPTGISTITGTGLIAPTF